MDTTVASTSKFFRGTVPVTTCGRLSGQDCAEIVTPDDETCPAGHPIPTRELPARPEGIFTGARARRPQIVGNHQVEYVALGNETEIAARLAAHPNDLDVSRRACEECADHHGIDQDAARAELRLLVSAGAAAGHLRRTPGGYWYVRHEHFTAYLDPACRIVVRYSTLHYERTPSEVLAGIPSRFGRDAEAGPPLPLEQLRQAVAGHPIVSRRLVSSWARHRRCSPQQAAVELSAMVASAAANGIWEQHQGSTWRVTEGGQSWIVTANGIVLATWPVATSSQPAAS